MSSQLRVGFSSQKVRYEWLERVARMCLAGMSPAEIQEELCALLSSTLSSKGSSGRGSREKAITILKRVWVSPRKDLGPLREAGLQILSRSPVKEHHLAVHWGMIMAAYPFWGNVAFETGRLLRLQNKVTAKQIRRRLIERYGDRELIARATRNVVRSFVDWKVLSEARQGGVYTESNKHVIDDATIIAWLIEALLHSLSNGSITLRAAFEWPSLFPFQLRPISPEQLVEVSHGFEVLRQGVDQDIIMLRSA